MANTVPAFVSKLWKMVDDPGNHHLISWSEHGSTFIIHKPLEFTSSLLPYYYKHSNMSSFVRQLNMYGFHKVVSVDGGGLLKLPDQAEQPAEFSHPYFVQNAEELLPQIRRKLPTSTRPSMTWFAHLKPY